MRPALVRVRRTAALPLLLLVLVATPTQGQQAVGRVMGRVVDAQSGRSLTGSFIEVVEGAGTALAGLDGRFVLTDVPAGPVTVRVSSLGYGTKTVTGVDVAAGATTRLDVALDPAALEMEGITVSAARERGSVASALSEQRNATRVTSGITAEEISRTPDGDAAAAARRISGVTVQDGKYVEARGMGERYTTTALNGARMPSPEPERKMVPLDMFPSGSLQSITTNKTFTPDLPGDFTGAQVELRTRTPTQRSFKLSTSTGFNSVVAGQTILQSPGVGSEWLALAASERSVPAPVQAFGSFVERPPSQTQVNQMISSFRNVWTPRSGTGAPSGSFSAALEGSDPLFGQEVGYLLTGTYGYSQEVKADQVRAQAIAQAGAEAQEVDRFTGSSGGSSVLWGGMASLSTGVGLHSRFLVNGVYNRTADHEGRSEEGFSENHGQRFRIQRLRYVERAMHSLQLGGEHQLGSANRFDWTVTRSGVARREPDRSEIVYQLEPGQPARWFGISNEAAVRTFGDLEEQSLEGALDWTLSFGDPGAGSQLRVGGLVRSTDRAAENRAYALAGVLNHEQRALSPEEIFDGRFSEGDEAILRITPLAQGGSYEAEDRLAAGYLMLDWALGSRLRVIGGARLERSEVMVRAQSTLGDPEVVRPEYTDVLPSLALHWRLGETQALRFSAAQTLSRPEYRELADVQYREVLGGDNVIGNPALRRALIKNFDARWEWYPSPAEGLSVALFAKDLTDPIERVHLATSGTRILTFENADGARNYGVELEARKGLGSLAAGLSPFSLFSNLTLMKSEIRLSGEGVSLTAAERPMVGQAGYVLNTGLTWSPDVVTSATSATLLYNVAGKRIAYAAEAPLPDVYEMPRHLLDVSVRFPLAGGVSGKADFKNVLDSPFELRQGNVVRESWRSGRAVSFGVSWQPGR